MEKSSHETSKESMESKENDLNISESYKRKNNLEDQVPIKKQRDNKVHVNEAQLSPAEENQFMNISKENFSEDCHVQDNVKQMNQSEDSEISNINPYVYQSMSAENNPFTTETIYLSKGILCFEKTNSSARSKPLVCNTIFVNGLPQKITKGIIQEIFQRCGPIEAIKLAGSESCYVTFSEGISASYAMRFSGYRLNINTKNEAPNSGILLIDYVDHSSSIHSQSASNFLMPSHSDTHFSKHGALILFEKIKENSTFHEALSNLTELLKQKECLKKYTDYLFPLMHNIYCHLLYLVEEKEKFELDVTNSKSDIMEQIKETLKLLVDIENFFKLTQENIWSYFTKGQKRYIKIYETHCKAYKSGFMEELASYENILDEQNNQPKENIEFCKENGVSVCNLEDSEGQNRENSFNPMTYFLAHCTDSSVAFICEKLMMEETFIQAADTVIMWLEQEECSAENATSFFSMLQCIHNHGIKLQDKKNEYEESFQDAKTTLIKHFREILCSLTKVERIYWAVSLDQCSNHFSLTERENIELWKKYAKKLKSDIKRRIYEIKSEIKADRENENVKFYKELTDKIQKLRDEQSSLRKQIEELKNNIATLKSKFKKDFEDLDRKINAVNKAIRKSQKRISKLKAKSFTDNVELRELRNSIYGQNIGDQLQADSPALSQDQARIISLISIFLNIRPGASMDSIYTYLHGIDSSISCRAVENLMRRFPTIFQEEIIINGANFLRKWYLISIS